MDGASTVGTTHYALRTTHYALRSPTLLSGIVLLALLWGGFATGANYVVRPQPDAVTPPFSAPEC